MVKIRGETVIARGVEDVFDFVADERNEPRYNPRMMRAEKVTAGPVGRGTRWATTVDMRGNPVDLAIEITEYDRPRRLGSTTIMPSAEISGAVSFKPEGEGTRLRWSWDLRLHGLMRLLAPIMGPVGQRQEAQTWAALKRYLEDRATAGRP